jgi:predicted nuclease of predicted toxin-antitoxin system
MRILDLPLLADENIRPDLVAALVASGVNIVTAVGEGLGGSDDVEILRHAMERGRVVLTHDSDFGMLAIRRGEPFVGIVHSRPGNLPRGQVREMLDNLTVPDEGTQQPFIMVAERRAGVLRVRVRREPRGE